jgi:hypothetical protein
MVTRESVHQEVFRRYQRAQERLRPLTEEPEYKEKAYNQIEKIIKSWGFEENAKKVADCRIWRLLDEQKKAPEFEGENEAEHLLGPIYAALRTHGGMYDFEIAHDLRKPVFQVSHGLYVLAKQGEGCPMKALGSKCVNLKEKLVGTRTGDMGVFGEYQEAVLRYANSSARGSGVKFQFKQSGGGDMEEIFVLEDGTEAVFKKKSKKFSYNGKEVEPPVINDLFRKSWYEWRAKHA